jgi:hypothetical protein
MTRRKIMLNGQSVSDSVKIVESNDVHYALKRLKEWGYANPFDAALIQYEKIDDIIFSGL